MYTACPYCYTDIDLEYDDSEWVKTMAKWVSNEDLSNFKKEEECPGCNRKFLINKIER